MQAKLRLALEWKLGGVAYWNLLRPFAQNWAILGETIWPDRGSAGEHLPW